MSLDAMQHVGSSLIRDRTLCLLHWQAESLPLSHQGIPHSLYLDCREWPSSLDDFSVIKQLLLY